MTGNRRRTDEKGTATTVLEIENLRTYYRTNEGYVHACDGVSLTLEEHETLGLVGESGSGKTTIARSINRVLPDNAEIVSGSIRFQGRDLTQLSERELRSVRWEGIAYIPQSAMNAFDPVYTIGEQIVEVIRSHEPNVSKREARARAEQLFDLVNLERSRLNDYPHQLSGGMRQRSAIAMALALDPPVLLADEPTTALDVIIQDQILNRIKEIQAESDSAMVMITHDISVVSETCDTIAVVYGGRVMEYADTETIITDPHHPYTMGLRNAFPTIEEGDQQLISIPGTPPELVSPGEGCRFAPRCPFAVEKCKEETPEREEITPGHFVECHRADEAEELQRQAERPETWKELATAETGADVSTSADESTREGR